MKTWSTLFRITLAFLLLTPFIGYSKDSQQKTRVRLEINQDWDFYLEKNPGTQLELYSEHANWERVLVPHTLELVPADVTGMDISDQTRFHRKVGWRKKPISSKTNVNQKVFPKFEGVHQVTNLWANGNTPILTTIRTDDTTNPFILNGFEIKEFKK